MQQPTEQPVKTKRDAFMERLKGRYPDKTFDDDEAVYGQINDDYDDYDGKIKRYQDDEKALVDLFNKDERSAAFLSDWQKGEDPVSALVRRFGADIVEAMDDPEKADEIAEANKEYLERLAQSRELDEQYEKNIGESIAQINALQKEKGYTDEEIDKGMDKLIQIAYDAIVGKFSPEALEFAFKGLTHDRDVETAAHEAEVRGRNANIEAKLKKRAKGDGMPTAANAHGSRPQPMSRPDLGVLGKADEPDIWARGDFKRK